MDGTLGEPQKSTAGSKEKQILQEYAFIHRFSYGEHNTMMFSS